MPSKVCKLEDKIVAAIVITIGNMKNQILRLQP